jgi:predicted HD superfamily hydrolase involved in NAD metabolism
MLRGFKRWYLYREILSLCTLAVANRNALPFDELERYANELREDGGDVMIIDFDATIISSTEVRSGGMIGNVTDEVYKYIKEHRLYMAYDYEKLLALVPERRLAHTLGVEKAALELKERHFPTLSEDDVRAAAILHDVTKYYSVEEHIALLENEGVKLKESEMRSKRVLHQISGSVIARQLGMSDSVVNAIRYHTTGRKKMSDIEKVILFADYIEENRDYEGLVEIRENYETLLASGDVDALDKAIVFALDTTIKEVIMRGEVIHPDTIEARNYLIENISA